MIEKILGMHADREVRAGEIADVAIDCRIARDFGGANVVKNLEENNLGIDDPSRTFFTFDCNPGGSDQKYATNQQICRTFAERHGIRVYDINCGIGTHLAIDEGLVHPGATAVSTDSHANILGAIGAFGQGMGDRDIAYVWAYGRTWFKVPPTVKLLFKGRPPSDTSAKDITLHLAGMLGAKGLLGAAAEVHGEYVEELDVDARVTIASMGTEMGAIIILFPPSGRVVEYCRERAGDGWEAVYPDEDASYERVIEVDLSKVRPCVARPGHPDDVVPVERVRGTRIHSAFLGSCTNGRYSDMAAAARILEGRRVAPGVVLKIVPSTDEIWRKCLDGGVLEIFKRAGALVGNAGCAGCAAGQIGQNGPGEVTVSTGNRNFPGKQGKGEVYLASPATVAASAAAGCICTPEDLREGRVEIRTAGERRAEAAGGAPCPTCRACDAGGRTARPRPRRVRGRVWIIDRDNIDTDMIYHNKHLAVTDQKEMGRYTFGNLEGWEDFPSRVKPGDIVIAGENFGCGSSRQHAVDCFKSLGVSLIIARSFGAIYERNAVNAAMPIMTGDLSELELKDGDEIEVDFETGEVRRCDDGRSVRITPFSKVQMEIYERGGLFGE